MELPEQYEQWLAFIASMLPQPVDQQHFADGSVLFEAGEPREVAVRLTPTVVLVSEYVVLTEGRRTPLVAVRRVGAVNWRRLPESDAMRVVEALVHGARQSRLSTYRVCRSCERRMPPERMHDEEVCQRCAEPTLRVVH